MRLLEWRRLFREKATTLLPTLFLTHRLLTLLFTREGEGETECERGRRNSIQNFYSHVHQIWRSYSERTWIKIRPAINPPTHGSGSVTKKIFRKFSLFLSAKSVSVFKLDFRNPRVVDGGILYSYNPSSNPAKVYLLFFREVDWKERTNAKGGP